MIAKFSVSNYRSIKEEQTISFVTTKDKTNKDLLSVEVAKGVFINKLAIFFGPNASGKSNILKAMETLFMLMCTPTQDKSKPISRYIPFKLESSDSAPSSMKIEFYSQGKKYWYEVVFDKKNILEEKLYYTPTRSKALFYSRQHGGDDEQPKITFGNTLKLSTKTQESIRQSTFNNHSVLSTIAKLSLKEDAAEIKSLYNWVLNHVHNINGDYHYKQLPTRLRHVGILSDAALDSRKKEFYTKLLTKADFNITKFELIDDKESVPQGFADIVLNDKDLSDEEKAIFFKNVVFINHSESGDFPIPLKLQSEGTIRFFELMEILYDLVTDNHIYFLDELGNNMHYDLISYYINLYLYNSTESQLFFTSQSILLLDEDFIRRDVVYLAQKDKDTASSSYTRVSDIGLHKNLSLYNAYHLGKLGSKPDLGSPYLNLSRQ